MVVSSRRTTGATQAQSSLTLRIPRSANEGAAHEACEIHFGLVVCVSGEVSTFSVMISVRRRLRDSVFGLPSLDSLVGHLKLSISFFISRMINTFYTGDVLLCVCSLHLAV